MTNNQESYIEISTTRGINSLNYYVDAQIAYGSSYTKERLSITNKRNIGKGLIRMLNEEKTKSPIRLVSATPSLNLENLTQIKKELNKKFPKSEIYPEIKE